MLKGIIIGMIVSIPVGPLGLITIQRIINRGWKTGFFSGIGTAASDLVYSSIAILGMSFMDDFIGKHKYLINGITGILFLIVGINILIGAIENKKLKIEIKEEAIHPALSNFLMGLSNPMTFLIFLAIFTKLGVDVNSNDIIEHLLLVIFIFIGSCGFWLFTSSFVSKSKNNYKLKSFIIIDKIIGTIIILFGIFSILKGLTKF